MVLNITRGNLYYKRLFIFEGHVHIDDELTITRLKRQLNQKNMEVSQKDRAIQALQDKEASRYNELDSAYANINLYISVQHLSDNYYHL